MKFLFVTYRWGADILGGAEIHHRRLVKDLLELGHEVEVWTTTGKDIRPVAHWGVQWTEGYAAGESVEDGVRVRRFPIKATKRWLLGLAAKAAQREMEKETLQVINRADKGLLDWWPGHPGVWGPMGEGPILLWGFHHPELESSGQTSRWTMQEFEIGVNASDGGTLMVSGYSPQPKNLSVRADHTDRGALAFKASLGRGWFTQKIDIPSLGLWNARFSLDKVLRPLKDHRTLGVRITDVRFEPRNQAPAVANLWEDERTVGRRHPEKWWKYLRKRCESRRAIAGRRFDYLRGPRSSQLEAALKKAGGFDAVVACNLPWATIPMVARTCKLPMMAMALWHLEDDYYYWSHYIDALKGSKIVLANTDFAAKQFYEQMGIKARFVGPGVPIAPPEPPDFDPLDWKRDHGIDADEAVVLSVCRKSPEKRYDLVAEAVDGLRTAGRRVRFVLVGPDNDHRPLPDHVVFTGPLKDAELDAAYRACDVFVLMSESESFGMVLAEAWLRGKPVIANGICGPSASLIDVGVDGLLARDADSLAAAVTKLLDDWELAKSMGERGREKSERDFLQRAATLRFLDAAKISVS